MTNSFLKEKASNIQDIINILSKMYGKQDFGVSFVVRTKQNKIELNKTQIIIDEESHLSFIEDGNNKGGYCG